MISSAIAGTGFVAARYFGGFAIGAGTSAAVQYAIAGQVNTNQVVDDAILGGLLGLFSPVASAAPALVRGAAANAARTATFGGFTKAQLVEAACVADRGGFTVAGRSLTKHGAGARPGNQAFPPARGNPEQINRQAQQIVEEILSNQNSRTLSSHRGRFGDTIEVVAPDGRGVVFDARGQFLFFRE